MEELFESYNVKEGLSRPERRTGALGQSYKVSDFGL